jgi:formylglycine-generating enzyme
MCEGNDRAAPAVRSCGGRFMGPRRVLRGGSFNKNGRNARSAYRNHNDPDNRNDNIGFRVVVSTFFAPPEMPGGERPSRPR